MCSEEKVKQFYIKHLESKIHTIEDPAELLLVALKLAWNDAMSYEIRFNEEGSLNKHTEDILEECKKSEKLSVFTDNNCSAVDNFHLINDKHKEWNMRIRVWQKFQNMTLKYLRCCQGNCSININEIINIKDWAQCECPIDTKIAKTLYRKALDDEKAEIAWKVATSVREFSWNFFSEETYTEMQNMIREYCSKNDIIGPLFFDFEYWE